MSPPHKGGIIEYYTVMFDHFSEVMKLFVCISSNLVSKKFIEWT